MVQILLVLEVLFTQDSEVEDLFCGASSRSEPSLKLHHIVEKHLDEWLPGIMRRYVHFTA